MRVNTFSVEELGCLPFFILHLKKKVKTVCKGGCGVCVGFFVWFVFCLPFLLFCFVSFFVCLFFYLKLSLNSHCWR